MKQVFLIEDIVGKGYYNIGVNSFRGFLFATKFSTHAEAMKELNYGNIKVPCQIITIFIPE